MTDRFHNPYQRHHELDELRRQRAARDADKAQRRRETVEARNAETAQRLMDEAKAADHERSEATRAKHLESYKRNERAKFSHLDDRTFEERVWPVARERSRETFEDPVASFDQAVEAKRRVSASQF